MGTIVTPGAPTPIPPLVIERLIEVVRLLADQQIIRALHLADQIAVDLGMVD